MSMIPKHRRTSIIHIIPFLPTKIPLCFCASWALVTCSDGGFHSAWFSLSLCFWLLMLWWRCRKHSHVDPNWAKGTLGLCTQPLCCITVSRSETDHAVWLHLLSAEAMTYYFGSIHLEAHSWANPPIFLSDLEWDSKHFTLYTHENHFLRRATLFVVLVRCVWLTSNRVLCFLCSSLLRLAKERYMVNVQLFKWAKKEKYLSSGLHQGCF